MNQTEKYVCSSTLSAYILMRRLTISNIISKIHFAREGDKECGDGCNFKYVGQEKPLGSCNNK